MPTNASRWWEGYLHQWWRRQAIAEPYGPLGRVFDAQTQWTKAHWPKIYKVVPTSDLTLTTTYTLIPGMTLTFDAGPVGAEWAVDISVMHHITGVSVGNFVQTYLYIDGVQFMDRVGGAGAGAAVATMDFANFFSVTQHWAGTSEADWVGPGEHTFEFRAGKSAAAGAAAVNWYHTAATIHVHRF